MADLEAQLKQARADGARFILIATDGVFSMDGYYAKLPEIRALADQYGALVMVDDCHATGFTGPKGAGTPARAGVTVDILTGTSARRLAALWAATSPGRSR
jgi:glycine C-acetyltransferase